MAKPKPIEYKLKRWDVSYKPQGFDIGADGPEPVDYEGYIIWSTNNPDVKPDTLRQGFHTLKEALDWIEKETEQKYVR